MKAITARISKRVRAGGRGTVWTPSDFLDLGTRAAVDQGLRRLVGEGVIRRLARGVYDYPKVSSRLGPLTPTPDAVARAVTRGSRIEVTGERAVNAVGLSNDVPARARYYTDGPSRSIQIGRQKIEIQHTHARNLEAAGTHAGLAFQAMRHLGRENVDEKVVRRLRRFLEPNERQRLKRATRHAPEWMRRAADKIATDRR